MNTDRDEWISTRAYALWEEAGRPEGEDHNNWTRAALEFEMMAKTRASVDGAEVLLFRVRAKHRSLKDQETRLLATAAR